MANRASVGRPEVTSHAAIEQASFRLFKKYGFEATTLEAIAREASVGRRTLFRYYRSKSDIPWGQFDRTLDGFRQIFERIPEELGLYEGVARAIIEFNRFPADASPPHIERMRLIFETPTLQAHSALRYAEWRQVIADYAAARLGQEPHQLEPRLLGHVGLALAMAAYQMWLDDPTRSITELLEDGMDIIAARVRL